MKKAQERLFWPLVVFSVYSAIVFISLIAGMWLPAWDSLSFGTVIGGSYTWSWPLPFSLSYAWGILLSPGLAWLVGHFWRELRSLNVDKDTGGFCVFLALPLVLGFLLFSVVTPATDVGFLVAVVGFTCVSVVVIPIQNERNVNKLIDREYQLKQEVAILRFGCAIFALVMTAWMNVIFGGGGGLIAYILASFLLRIFHSLGELARYFRGTVFALRIR